MVRDTPKMANTIDACEIVTVLSSLLSMLESLLETKLSKWLGVFVLFKLFLAIFPTIYRKIYSLLAPANWNSVDLRYYGEWAENLDATLNSLHLFDSAHLYQLRISVAAPLLITISVDYKSNIITLWKMFDIVVTGSTDGLGKAFSKELAKRGLNIILISRNEEKLKSTAEKIEEEHGVKTLVVQADFKNRDCYSNIKKKLDGKDIGILVNNVGMVRRIPAEYTTIDEDFIWNEIDVNCGSVCMMTRIVLPLMKPKGKGLVVNISSLASDFGSPSMGTYASTKCFINMFSSCIRKEMEYYNIKVKCLTPGFVETNMTKISKPFFENYPTIAKIFFPDAKSYVESAVKCFCEEDMIATGYWGHTLMRLMLIWMPLKLRVQVTYLFVKMLTYYSTKRKRQ